MVFTGVFTVATLSPQESAESFQLFISRCCAPSVAPLDQTMFDISEVMDQHHVALPTALLKVYKQIRRNNLQAKHGLGETMVGVIFLPPLSISLLSSLHISSWSDANCMLDSPMLTEC